MQGRERLLIFNFGKEIVKFQFQVENLYGYQREICGGSEGPDAEYEVCTIIMSS